MNLTDEQRNQIEATFDRLASEAAALERVYGDLKCRTYADLTTARELLLGLSQVFLGAAERLQGLS
jgi:hypothetical protein